MPVVATITATNISTSGVTINYTLGTLDVSNIYLYRFPTNVPPNPLNNTGTYRLTVVSSSSGSYTDTGLTSNTQYSYAFYNGNSTTGSSVPYSPFVNFKTYTDVSTLTTSAITETSNQINYTLSNTLSSLTTTCYLYRFVSTTSIPSAPSTLNTSSGTFITSVDMSSGSNAIPTVLSSNYIDSTLSSNTSYVYAFYNGQVDTVSTVLTNTSAVAKTASSTTFSTVSTSTMTTSNISNNTATINYTIVNAISVSTNSYLFRFAATGSAPTTDPTSGIQVGSAITTSNGGTSTTPITSTGLSPNIQYTFAFYNETSSSATILRDATGSRLAQTVSLYTTNVLNTNLTATSITPVSATINYTLSNTPSSTATTVYLYRFSGTNSAPSILSGGTSMTSVNLTTNNSPTSGSFSSTGLTANNNYTYAFYSGNVSGTSIILTSDGSASISVSINTTVNTVAFSATTNILNTSATVNYTLSNASSTTVPSYLYRFALASAPAILNSNGTFVASNNSIGTADSINDTGLTNATQYTYAFYNGQINGTSSIITNLSGVAQSTTFNTTNLFNSAISATSASILNTQATITYTLTNLGTNTSNATAYLYRFLSGPVPTSNPTTSGTLITSVVDSSNTTLSSQTYVNTGLSPATQYFYAFYNGSVSSSTILTNSSLVNQSVSLTTTNIVLNTLTATNITNNSAQINYNISNATTTQGTSVYLYRFTAPTTPPTTLTGGTNIITGGVSVNGSATVDSSYNNTGLSSNIFYYAFYNGNSGTSTIIPIATGGNYITVKDFVDVSVLTATSITPTSANINYTLNNGLSVDVTSYLYRFVGTTIAPTTNPTGGTNVYSVATTSGTSTGFLTFPDLSLNVNKVYVYAFYTGTTSSAAILQDVNGVAKSVSFVTSEYVTSLSVSSITTTSATMTYSITNPLTTQITAYLYRFVIGNSIAAPLSNPTTGTQITTVDISGNSSVSLRTFSSTGLTQNTGYTFAFYTVNTTSGTILTDFSGNAQSVSLFTDMYVRTLQITYSANTYLTISYRLGNAGIPGISITNTSYLYRFTGATAPTVLNLDLSGATFTTVSLSSTSSGLTYNDIGLTPGTQYTYAFYDGSANGISTIMNLGTSSGPSYPLSAVIATGYTSNLVVGTFTSAAIFNTSAILSYTITNNPASTNATVYLYRFTGTTPPTTLSGGTNITIPTNTVNLNSSLTNTAFSTTGLTASTTYYYAFYNGQTNGTSTVIPISGGGNYITVKTTGVYQPSISASAITSNGATINYTIIDASNSSPATVYLYRYKGVITATTPLNTTSAVQVSSVSNPTIPFTLDASGTISTSVSVSDLSTNSLYTFQFYNGNTNGSSPILSTTASGGTNQFVVLKTGVSSTALSNSNITNTTATVSYSLSNTNNTSITSYLYQFTNSAPTTLTGGTLISPSVLTGSGTAGSPTIRSGSFNLTGLSANTTYYYAFYNGTSTGTSTILTDTSGTSVSTSFTTSNLRNTILTTNALTSTSVTIGYTLTNNSVSQTAFLYRFQNSTAPSTLNTTSGTNIIVGGVLVGVGGVVNTVTNSSLTANTTYTYAFYNGQIDGSSNILTSNGSTPIQLTVFTTTNVVITVLNPTSIMSSQATINYNLYNYQGTSKLSYLYRFTNSSAPATLNTSTGTSIISANTAAISSGVPGNTTGSTTNTGLTSNTKYTYGFYNGNANGTSVLLTNYSGNALTTTIYTTNESIVSSITSSNHANTFNTISYSVNNSQPTQRSLYLYRFVGTTAPSTLDSSFDALITNFTLNSGASLNNSILDTSLILNTSYTYAFYNGNVLNTSTVLTSFDGTPQVLNISTTNVFNPILTASAISTNSATINYTITNIPSSSGIILYLYRFNGLSAPTTLTTTGSYSSAVSIYSFAISNDASTNFFYVDNTISANTNYTYAFYNGNDDGTNTILQDASSTLNPVSVSLNTYYGVVSSLSTSGSTNTSTNVNYTITTDLANPSTVYLYRFDASGSATSTLNTGLSGATNVKSIDLSSNGVVNSSYFDPTLSYNSSYTYAIYSGTTNGVSTILTDSSNVGQSAVATTSNAYNPSLTVPVVSTTSATIGYTLNNNPSNVDATVYLYRFDGTSAPSTLSNSGTFIMPSSISVSKNTSATSTYTDSTVLPDMIYTYAFYNGNTTDSSLILKDNSTNLLNVSATIYTFYDIIAGLSATSTSNTASIVSYSIQNTLSSITTAYLYRFNNSITPPSTLNTGLYGATNVASIDISANSTSTSSYFDPGLSINSTYTYALYNGTSSGSSVILTDVNNIVVSAVVRTSNVYNPVLTNTSTSTSSVIVNYRLNNKPSNADANVYLYRFDGNSAPSALSSSGTFIMPSYVSVAKDVSLNDTFVDSSVVAGNEYTYAFYDGNAVNFSNILQDNSTNLVNVSLTVDLFFDLILSLTASGTTNTSTIVNYSIQNTQSSPNTVYLYRFDGSITVPDLLNIALTGAVNLTNSGITIGSNSTDTFYYFDPTLSPNSIYTYAFYNGTANGSSAVLTNNLNVGQSVSVSTSNVYNSVLSASSISPTSVSIDYTLDNNPSAIDAMVYLYRYNGTSASSTLFLSGTLIQSDVLVSHGTSVSYTYTDNTVVADSIYTYAFYDGSGVGITPILQNNSTSLSNQSLTVYTFYDIITTLTAGTTTNTYTTINYSIQNKLTSDTYAYLYRFDGLITPPTTLDTGLSGTQYLTSIFIGANSTNASYYFDPTLLLNSSYTYALYNGTTNGSSIILTDVNNVGQYVGVSTSNIYNPSLTVSSLSESSITINYSLNNIPSNSDATVYLYRFDGTPAPSILIDGTSISGGIFLSANNDTVSSITDSTVSVNNTYTYAFYSGNLSGSSVILQDNSTSLMNVSLTVDMYYDLVIDLSCSGTTNTSTIVSYSIQNILTNSTTVYLYRFTGSVSAPSPLDAGLYNATNVSIIPVSGNGTATSTYTDSTLDPNTTYTYALYDGTNSGSSLILTNSSNTPVQTQTTTTGGYSAPITYPVFVSTFKDTSVAIVLVGTDPQSSPLTYTSESPSNGSISGVGPNLLYTPNPGYTGTDSFLYYATNLYSLSSTPSTVNVFINDFGPPCFKEGTMILTDRSYRDVKDLRKGDLVKTLNNGFVPIHMIGYSQMYNSGNGERIKERLYRYPRDTFPEQTDDLIITGCHSILIEEFKDEEQKQQTIKINGDIYITDDKYRLPACVDVMAIPYEEEGMYTIYHFALDNDDYYMNYGIFANGVLVETTSQRYLKEISNMTLIE